MYKPEVTVRIDSYFVVANNPYSQEGVVAGVNALLNVLYIGFLPIHEDRSSYDTVA